MDYYYNITRTPIEIPAKSSSVRQGFCYEAGNRYLFELRYSPYEMVGSRDGFKTRPYRADTRVRPYEKPCEAPLTRVP
jgi:hypothetical protein